ncbi:class I SAM-dependent DNA methyltransferase [Paenibacillus sp. GCM10012307]|uniref:N-6 DNA methylase n=1 Tax=Paenibacillus roseus TaxID=2798579 RepID=A0A934J986_9BACL|nr:N-6 DNA methylase [Paenibacillus roseus]MBJ6364174.1 N-6 DNA methylase [Paenibacillus roseus]
MGKASRARWDGNVRSMAIVAKHDSEITEEDRQFLRDNYTSTGGLLPNAYAGGAFYTPTHVAKFIVQALEGLSGGFAEGQRWLEPSCGSGVFLEHIPNSAEITGLEIDPTSARVSSLLYPYINVVEGDALTHDRRDYYDFIIGNPPYGVSIDVAADDVPDEYVSLSKKKAGRLGGKSECAFIELAIKAAKPGGYIAFVLPMGLNYASYAEKVRHLLYRRCWHVATVHLPGETFALTGTTIATQILIMRKATPNARMIPAVTKRWGSNFKRGGYEDMTDFAAEFLEGQPPAYFATITDIGYDKHGKLTDKWGDGHTQLDELLADFTDDNLTRENLYPHIPSWHSVTSVSSFMFSHGNGRCDGARDGELTYVGGPYRWNELTMGAGEEITWGGREWSTMDFEWQDAVVTKYYEELDRIGNGLTDELKEV